MERSGLEPGLQTVLLCLLHAAWHIAGPVFGRKLGNPQCSEMFLDGLETERLCNS